MALNRLQALNLLSECTGDDIWSLDHCRLRRVPESWIEELADCFESGFLQDSQTIYAQGSVVNQYHGIRDVDLAMKLGEYLGVPVTELQAHAATRSTLVRSIQERVEEE